MVGRGELTEEAWSVIAPLLPSSRGRCGDQWRDHRTVINGSSEVSKYCATYEQALANDLHVAPSAKDSYPLL